MARAQSSTSFIAVKRHSPGALAAWSLAFPHTLPGCSLLKPGNPPVTSMALDERCQDPDIPP